MADLGAKCPHGYFQGARGTLCPECNPQALDIQRADGRKDDTAKDRWDLLPWGAVREVVRVLTWGARYYAPHNWKQVPNPRERYLAAIHRHLVERFEDGQRRDPKTNLHHLAHVVSNALFLLWFDLTDDLVVEPPRKCVCCGGDHGPSEPCAPLWKGDRG